MSYITRRVPVPIEILQDELVERVEDFRLALVRHVTNPSTNLAIGPNTDTQVVIEDEEGKPASITRDIYNPYSIP